MYVNSLGRKKEEKREKESSYRREIEEKRVKKDVQPRSGWKSDSRVARQRKYQQNSLAINRNKEQNTDGWRQRCWEKDDPVLVPRNDVKTAKRNVKNFFGNLNRIPMECKSTRPSGPHHRNKQN